MICVVSKNTTTNRLQFVNSQKRLTFNAEQSIPIEEDCFIKNDNETQFIDKQGLNENPVRNHLDLFVILAAILGFGGFACYSFFHKKPTKNSDMGFISLNDNIKVPTLETCKSINKDLKEMLENQIKLSNCDKKNSGRIRYASSLQSISFIRFSRQWKNFFYKNLC